MTAPTQDVGAGRSWRWSASGTLIAVSYAVLGGALVVTRLAGLGHSLWLDEAHFVENFVRAGPREILASGGLTHQLYALLDWMTASVFGESVIGFRLWSAVPFVAGVGVMTTWLHRRVDGLTGLLFLFLATVSPLLLDLSRQARGYGLAFLAMSILVVAALEAQRTGRIGALVAMFAAGLVGTLTLPQFGFAFIATALVLLIDRRVRLPVVVGLLLSIVALVLWYAPHSQQVEASSQGTAGTAQTNTAWVLTAPIDQILLPALIWLEGPLLEPGASWIPFVLLAAVVMAFSPLLHQRGSALVLCAGPVTSVVALWLAGAYVAPRFLSFLLVPLFVLVASGASAILTSIPARRTLIPAAVCLVVIAALSFHFVSVAPDVVRLPREANRDAADLIESRTLPATPVYAQLKDPIALQFYLDTPIQVLQPAEVALRVCTSQVPLVYVMQPQAITLVDIPCLRTRVVEHRRFEQYARGGEINVWFVPPEA